MTDHQRRALEYIRNAGGMPEVTWFDDDHDPIGPQLRSDLRRMGMTVERQGRIELTDVGRLELTEGHIMRPSDAKLAAALHEAGLDEMAKRAEQGIYNEFFGPLGTPELVLVGELALAGTPQAEALRQRVIDGEFDAGIKESEEWAASPEGQNAFGRLLGRKA